MKYIIPERIVFKYLDLEYGDLEEHKPENYEGVVFKKPNDETEYGIMGFKKNDKTLYIYYKLIEEISSMFSLEYDDSKDLIGKWVEDRYKLKVVHTILLQLHAHLAMLKIDIN